MRTPLQAMIWELWRTSRLELLGRIAWMCGIVLLLCSSIVEQSVSEPEMHVLHGCFVLVLAATSLTSSTWWRELDRRQPGFSFRLGFVRPVSTTMLVAVPMLYSMTAGVICYTAPAVLCYWIEGVSIPVLGPAIVVAWVIPCIVAAVWSPTTLLGKTIALLGLAISMVTSLLVFHARSGHPEPFLMAMGRPEYYDFGWRHYAAFAAAGALALVVTVAAVERQRHGDRLWLEELVAAGAAAAFRRFQSLVRPATRRAANAFPNRFAAQCWYEWRCFGPTVLLLSAGATLLILVFVSIGMWRQSNWEGAPIAWLAALVLSPFAFQILGADGALGLSRRNGAIWLSAYDASRAMSNDHLIAIKLLMIAVCSLCGWLIMATAAALHATVTGDGQSWVRIGEAASRAMGDVGASWWITGVTTAMMLYISSTSIFLAFGMWAPKRPKLFVAAALVFYGHLILMVVDKHRDWVLAPLWVTYGYLISIAIVAGCVVALRKAMRAGFLGKRLFVGALSLWVVYVPSIIMLYLKAAPATDIPLPLLALGVSMLPVPLAATAIAPLALASHRHG